MTAQILVPLDGSSFGQQALPLAVSLAQRTQGVLHLVKVHVPPAPPVKGDLYIERAAQADSNARVLESSYLTELADGLCNTYDLRVETAVLTGPIVPALEMYSAENHISLVVMTTHGRGGLSRAWFGSVADALVRTVNVPVLVCRPQAAPQKPAPSIRMNHLLLPLYGSV
jgi:nucleotide-binding universal stress UspA family protein